MSRYSLLLVGGALVLGTVWHPADARAQDMITPVARPAVAPDTAVAEDDLLGDEELDALVAPVALYPDSLLTQVLVAATYPLDVLKADRFVDAHRETPAAERADLAEAEDWDPSVRVLAAGFPAVIDRMAEESDWTEQVGDAVLTQTDDVLDAVQRMRARAALAGNLESNEAQVVETDAESGAVSIAPADPDVVYVPTYDTATAFTTTAPVVVSEPGISTGGILTAGVIAFGGAMLLDEIFDDDDDWDDYWRGPRPIDWDDGDFYPGRGVNVGGDVNIERDREVNIDRDRVNIDRDRVQGRLGAVDPDRVDARKDGAWRASDQQRRQARDKIAARKEASGAHTGGARAEAARNNLAARDGANSGARERLETAAGKRKPEAGKGAKASALAARPEGKQAINRDTARAAKSVDRSRVGKAATSRPKAAGHAKPKQIAKANKAKPSVKRSPGRSSAMKQHHGGHKAKAAKARGGKSRRR